MTVARFAKAALLIALGSLAACSSPAQPAGGKSTAQTETCGPTKTFTNGFLSFRYSGCWTATTYNEMSTMSQTIVYLSDQATHDPCHAAAVGRTCAQPLSKLRPGHVLVQWSEGGSPNWNLDQIQGSPTTVGGQPARYDISRPGSCNGIGADETVSVTIARSTPFNWYRMTACLLAPGDPQAATAVQQMLSTVTFTGPA